MIQIITKKEKEEKNNNMEALDYVASIKKARKLLSYDSNHPIHRGPIKIGIHGMCSSGRSTAGFFVAFKLSNKPVCMGNSPKEEGTYVRLIFSKELDGLSGQVLFIDNYDYNVSKYGAYFINDNCWEVIIIVCHSENYGPKGFTWFQQVKESFDTIKSDAPPVKKK